MAGLVNLELRGNSVSNLDFMSGLPRLSYADLAYNNISDLAPLAGPSTMAHRSNGTARTHSPSDETLALLTIERLAGRAPAMRPLLEKLTELP